jgi:hypothetical protein
MEPQHPAGRRLGPVRLVAFSLLTTALVLTGVNALIGALGRRGVIDLHRPDDQVQFVEEDLLARQADGSWATTPYAEENMVPSRFAAERGDGFRLFVLGGSFAMGSPYSHQEDGRESPGGMASWLRARLGARSPEALVEVVNMGAGGEGSFRVKRILEEVVRHDPSAVFVATCNNEGAASPSAMREYLHTLGGYRLMTQLLAPTEAMQGRSLHTVQQAQVASLRDDFANNLRDMVAATAEAGVPLFLATLPTNLRYSRYSMSPFADGADITRAITREEPEPCVAAGRQAYEEGRWQDAVDALAECDDVAESLRWTGLALLELGAIEQGKAALEQSVELLPRNRCRPSFNALIREIAASAPHVHLVDLQAAAEDAAPDGVPGYEQFLDYCHMQWRGYAAMASVAQQAMEDAGVLPAGSAAVPPLYALAAELGMDRMDALDRVRAAHWE